MRFQANDKLRFQVLDSALARLTSSINVIDISEFNFVFNERVDPILPFYFYFILFGHKLRFNRGFNICGHIVLPPNTRVHQIG